MLHRLAVIVMVLSAAASCTVLVLEHLPSANQGEQPTADEGWRRTNSGWEMLRPRVASDLVISNEGSAIAHRAEPKVGAKPSPRLDCHPAVLALLLLLGAISGYSLFPNEKSAALRRESQSLF